MASTQVQAAVNAFNAKLAQDPTYQALYGQYKQLFDSGAPRSTWQAAQMKVRSYIDTTYGAPPGGYTLDPSTGTVTPAEGTDWRWLAAAIALPVGGALLAPLLGTGAAAGGAGSSGITDTGVSLAQLGTDTAPADVGVGAADVAGTTALGPTTADTIAQTSAVAGGSGVPADLAATTGLSGPVGTIGGVNKALSWASLIAGIATPLIGANIAAGANTTAANLQAQTAAANLLQSQKAAEAALGFEEAAYKQKQAQVAPYIGAGQGALANLESAWGITPGMGGTAPVALPNPALVGPPTATAGTRATPLTAPNIWAANGVAPTSAPNPTAPTNLATLGVQNTQAQAQTSSGVAQPGEQRIVNGQRATWNGEGWVAA